MNRKNKDLRVVRDSEDVDKLVRRIMDNTEDEETQMAQLEEQVKAHKKKIRIRILIVFILIMAASVGIYLYIYRRIRMCGWRTLIRRQEVRTAITRNFQKVCFVTVEMEWHI